MKLESSATRYCCLFSRSRFHFIFLPFFRLIFIASLLSLFGAAGMAGAGNSTARKNFLELFSVFSPLLIYTELMFVREIKKNVLRKNEGSRCMRLYCIVMAGLFMGLESVFLPWVLTQSQNDTQVSPLLSIVIALSTNLLTAATNFRAITAPVITAASPSAAPASTTATVEEQSSFAIIPTHGEASESEPPTESGERTPSVLPRSPASSIAEPEGLPPNMPLGAGLG